MKTYTEQEVCIEKLKLLNALMKHIQITPAGNYIELYLVYRIEKAIKRQLKKYEQQQA